MSQILFYVLKNTHKHRFEVILKVLNRLLPNYRIRIRKIYIDDINQRNECRYWKAFDQHRHIKIIGQNTLTHNSKLLAPAFQNDSNYSSLYELFVSKTGV